MSIEQTLYLFTTELEMTKLLNVLLISHNAIIAERFIEAGSPYVSKGVFDYQKAIL